MAEVDETNDAGELIGESNAEFADGGSDEGSESAEIFAGDSMHTIVPVGATLPTARCRTGDAISSLGDAISSLGGAISPLGDRGRCATSMRSGVTAVRLGGERGEKKVRRDAPAVASPVVVAVLLS